jgi:integrase
VNPDSDLTALPIVCENVVEIIGAAKAAWKENFSSDWQLDSWVSALEWVTQESTSLAGPVGGRFSVGFGKGNRNPVMGAMEKHSVYGALCNSHPDKQRSRRFRLLQAHLLVARVVLYRRHLDAGAGVMPTDAELLQDKARPQEAARAVRRFSEDPLLAVIDKLPVHLPPIQFTTRIAAISLKQNEAIRRLASLKVLLEKAFLNREQESRQRSGGSEEGSGRWIDGGKTDFQWRIVDLDEDGDSAQDEAGNVHSSPVTLHRTNRVKLTRPEMNDLLDADDYPFEDQDEEEACSTAHKDRAFSRNPGDFQAASSAWANHIEMANQMFPWSYGSLISSELRPLLVDQPASLSSVRAWDKPNLERLELLALVQVMFWTASSMERACEIRYLGIPGAPKGSELAFVPAVNSAPPYWRVRPELPRCRRPQSLDTRGMDRLREDFLDLPDIAAGSRLLLELNRLKGIPGPEQRGRIFRKPPGWYRKGLEKLLAAVSSDPRLTKAAIANFLMQRIRIRARGELTATAMITGRNIPLANVRLFYACRSVKKLQEIYATEASLIRQQLEPGYKIPGIASKAGEDSFIGNRQCPSVTAVREAVAALLKAIKEASPRRTDEQSSRYHNLFTLYTIWMFSYCTGVRGIRTPYLAESEIDPVTGLSTITDKDGGIGYKTRVVWVPEQLHRQMELYKDFVSRSPKVFQAGKWPCFFVNEKMQPREVRPQTLTPIMHEFLPFPVNIHRRFVSSELLDRGCPHEVVSAWMGHWHRGEEPWHAFSSFSFVEYRDLLKKYLGQLLFVELGFRPVHAW